MTKNNLERTGRIALFRTAETEPGSPSASSGVSMDFDSGSELKSSLAAEHDGDTIHGSELPARIFAGERECSGKLSQSRARPDFVAFALAYFFGRCSSASVGTTAYRHDIEPEPGLELPTFTAIQRRGSAIFAERLSGNYIEGFTIDLGEGWVSMSAEVKGTGAREVSYARETVAAQADATELTLASAAVEGDTAMERLENVHRVRAKDVGDEAWTVLSPSAVSDATPAVITLAEALGTSTSSVDYQIDYVPTEPGWCDLPAAIGESPLKLTDAKVIVDGNYNAGVIEGGEELRGELGSFSITGKNNIELSRFPGDAGPAALGLRGGREITISLSKALRDTVLMYQADHPETEQVSLALSIKGAPVDEGGSARFGAELVFPRCGILAAPVTAENGRLAQAGDLVVMDAGGGDSVIVRCWNAIGGYI